MFHEQKGWNGETLLGSPKSEIAWLCMSGLVCEKPLVGASWLALRDQLIEYLLVMACVQSCLHFGI